MKSLIRVAIVSATLGLLAAPAYANVTQDKGLISGSDSFDFGDTVKGGTFIDIFKFSSANAFSVVASFTNSILKNSHIIKNATFDLFSSTDPTFDIPGTVVSFGLANFGVLTADNLSAGSYFFQITGSSTGSASYGGSVAYSVSPVPLPSSLPMFGAGLLALAGVGFVLKRKGSETVSSELAAA